MRRKMFSVVSVLIILSMLIVMFAGCSSDGDTVTTTTAITTTTTKAGATTTTAVTTTAAEDLLAPYIFDPDKVYEVTYLISSIATVNPFADIIKDYEKYFNYKIIIDQVDDNSVAEQVNLKMAAGDIPDCLPLLKGNQLQEFARQGLLAEIPDVALEYYMPDYLENMTAMEPQVLDYYYLDGKRYGICSYFFVYNLYRRPVVYNGVWMNNVGVSDYPETIEEFEDLMYKFAKEDPDKNGKDDTYGISASGLRAVWGISGFDRIKWAAKDGHAVYGAVQEEMIPVIEMLKKWYNDGVLDPEFVTGENTGGYWALSSAFVTGRIGVTSHGYLYHWIKPTEQLNAGANYTEMAKYSQEAADKMVFGVPPSKDGVGGIGGDSVVDDYWIMYGKQLNEEPDKLGKILWFNRESDFAPEASGMTQVEWERYQLMGKEGVQWQFNDAGVPTYISGWDDLAKRQSEGYNTMFMGITDPNWYYEQAKPTLEFMKDSGLGDKGRYEPLYPGCVVFSKLNEYKAELQKIEDQAYIEFITGARPLSEFGDFVADWMAAGGTEVTAEIDEWYQNKP